MAEAWHTEKVTERVILVGVQVTFGRQQVAMADSLDELAELVKTAPGHAAGRGDPSGHLRGQRKGGGDPPDGVGPGRHRCCL